MSNPLEVNFSGNTKKKPLVLLLPLVDSSTSIPWKTMNYRTPWEIIPEKYYKGLNFNFTLNPDPNIDYYENTKKWLIPKVLTLIKKLKDDGIIKKLILVYEWGTYGKKHGKLHFHGLIQTNNKVLVQTEMLREFNKRSNVKHRTLQINHLPTIKDRARAIKYLKKEQQNKLKCLFYT